MIIRVQLFAVAREIAGSDEVSFEVNDGATIRDIRRQMSANLPAMDRILSHARWAVDAEFVSDDHLVSERSEIALIPPVSGG